MSWVRLQGHQHLIEAFRHVVLRRRLAHAYLFLGPPGVGKRLFAQELAKALLCEGPSQPDTGLTACDRCAACALVDANTHPDFFTVQRPEDKNEMPIELVQELCAGFALKSARGHGKVAILDDADDLNEESANCFLKTLEEPPPRSVFILIGTCGDRLLPSILSRCQSVRFGPLPDDAVAAILKQQDIHDPALLQRLVSLADGSPGQALALADAALWDFRKQLLGGLARVPIDTLALAKSFAEFVEDAAKEMSPQRRRAALVLRLLIEAFRDALHLSLGLEPNAADADERRLLSALTNRASPEKFLALLERCLETEQHIDRYVQLTLVLEALLDALSQLLEEGTAAMAAR
jgi:DNA polymerase-3 subunit delta'